jgi:pimeloyl-ACP methyl ester carboxylesterase
MKKTTIFKSETGRQAILQTYDTFLSHWPVAWEGLEVPTRHGKTFVLACGPESAPALVLLHGSTANSAVWAGDVVAYTSHYRVYAVDIPGEPGKSEALRWPLDGSDPSEWLGEVFDGLGLDQACLLGISLGGFMALKFATACPERVSKLVLLCPAGVARQKVSFLIKAGLFSFLGDWGFQRVMRMVNGKETLPQAAMDYLRLISSQFSPRMEVVPVLPDEAIQRLSMPVLLLVGESDALLDSQKTAECVSRLVPTARVQVLPGTHHLIVNRAEDILQFLQS